MLLCHPDASSPFLMSPTRKGPKARARSRVVARAGFDGH
jgi:hypothetical protein